MINLADYNDFFLFLGGLLITGGLIYFFLRHSLQNIFVSEEAISRLKATSQVSTSKISFPEISKCINPRSPSISMMFLIIIIVGFLFNQFLLWRMDSPGSIRNLLPISISITKKAASKLKLAPFDIALAKERMDKNNDGICDVCGMPIDQCINTGQIDCNMGGSKDAIGILGSQHIHADFKVYINGEALDFAKPEYYMKSSVLHVDNNQNKEDSSGVMHMHAKNVPLWLFFRSLGMKLEKSSLTLVDGKILKNENGNTLKFYLNGHKVDELENYVFQPSDKLLINYGPENDPNIQRQISSITNFAKDH